MRRVLAAAQLIGFGVAGIAMVEPNVSRHLRHWSGATIYPGWAALYAVVGVALAIGSMFVRDQRRALALPTLSTVMGAQLAGLGFVAVKHWVPSFGMGGGYAGGPHHLVKLAWVLGLAGTLATLAAVGQLISARVFPIRTSARAALPVVVVGALIVLLLPVGIAEGRADLLDVTSLGAFVLVYSAPIRITVMASSWLVPRLRIVAIASCAGAAAFSALDLITDLSYLRGRPALAATAILLGTLAVGLAWSSRPNAARARPDLSTLRS